MSRTPEQIVREFGQLWEQRDIEGIVQAMTENCVYANVPLPPMRGRDAVRNFITPNLTKADGVEFRFLAIATAADGRTVLTERIDAFLFGDKRVAIPLMGIFVLRGEEIAEWRDYADIGTFVRDMRAIGQMPGPGVAAAG
ncbi:MAG TPA: limonene-1,2-epoxide hydrolase family protein [Rhizomicrobium sp.]|nr:limonene-1,2-epoxide hydrolase family protein [Rhizomicrobium sp.]